MLFDIVRAGAFGAAVVVSAACGPDGPSRSDSRRQHLRPDYSEAAATLSQAIERERSRKALGAVSIALVEADDVVWAAGFGEERDGRAASPETVYRVGSVSKLFTDLAVMQLAERGEIDIDAPVTDYLPSFDPGGLRTVPEPRPSLPPITLRQLMSHRSGLMREPPAGHYFDPSEPGLAATVASINGTGLVYPPGERTKYSNAGIAVVGRVLEAIRGAPFAEYVRGAVLEPLAMETSDFAPRPELRERLAAARMWGLDRPDWPAPTFELGMAPAGSMYSTVLDLSRFVTAVLAGGVGERGRILDQATLESMWKPQFVPVGSSTGYGLGFSVGELGGERLVGHGGAIYGFSTQLSLLPDLGLGVAVASAVDITNDFTSRVATAALRLMMTVRAGEPLTQVLGPATGPLDPALARRLAGVYSGGNRGIELDERSGRLYATPLAGGFAEEVRALGDTLVVDGRLAFGSMFLPDGQDLLALGAWGAEPAEPARLIKEAASEPPPAPEAWEGLVGEYGWDHNVLYVLERRGRLTVLVEWFFLYPVEEVATDHAGLSDGGSEPSIFRFPDWGLYQDEPLVFDRDETGRARSVRVGPVEFARREVGTREGETFRVDPVRPVEELLAEALSAAPPAEEGHFRDSELVELAALDSSLKLDVRYATTNNFMSSVFYEEPRVFLQRPAAEAVVRVHRALRESGYGLLLHDGYRPWYVTKTFWDATPESDKLFVANPANGSRHNRGSAIDLSLFELATGNPVEMVGGFDEFSERSFPNYPGGTSRQRWLRALLRRSMEDEGFAVYEAEWWHFDHEDWREYGLGNRTFAELGN